MILNIVDNRTRPYRWRRIDAIIEATAHDNGCEDSDMQPPTESDVVYEQRLGISLQDAVTWAMAEPYGVTLFLYDDGDVSP